jgi:hypothetical protein
MSPSTNWRPANTASPSRPPVALPRQAQWLIVAYAVPASQARVSCLWAAEYVVEAEPFGELKLCVGIVVA